MSKSSTIKVFIFAVLLLIFAFLFWQQLVNVYLKGNLSWHSLLWLGIWLVFFLVFLLFFSLLVEAKGVFLVVYLLTIGLFFIFFPFHYYLLIGAGLLFLILLLSHALMQKERNERLKISLRPIFKNGLKLTLFFLALFLALVSYFYPLVKIDEKGISLPPKILESVLKPLSKNLAQVLPFFESEITIDEMIGMSLLMEKIDPSSLSPELLKKFQGKDLKEINLQELLKDPEIAEFLKQEAKKQVKKVDPKILARQRSEMSKSLGIELTGNEKIAEVINKLASKQLQRLLGPYIKYLPIISAILTFIVLSMIFVPFSWIVILVTLFVFMILKIFRIVRIEKVMREGEDVRI